MNNKDFALIILGVLLCITVIAGIIGNYGMECKYNSGVLIADSLYKTYQYDSVKINYLEGQVDLLQAAKSRLP